MQHHLKQLDQHRGQMDMNHHEHNNLSLDGTQQRNIRRFSKQTTENNELDGILDQTVSNSYAIQLGRVIIKLSVRATWFRWAG
jgi:hypothetical protein